MNAPGRIMLPKRWSRAKRKRMRRGIQWLREFEVHYRRYLDGIWGAELRYRERRASIFRDFIDQPVTP